MIKYLLLVLVFLYPSKAYDQIEDTLDSPNQIAKVSDTIQLDQIVPMIRERIYRDGLGDAIDYAEVFFSRVNELGYEKGLGWAYVLKGEIALRNYAFEKAIQYFDLAEDKFKKQDFVEGLSEVSRNRAGLEYDRGNYGKSADYFLENKMYNEMLGDSLKLVSTYNNLADAYSLIEDLEKSEEYYLKSITLAKNIGDVKNLGYLLSNLASLYINQSRFIESERLLNESLTYNNRIGNNKYLGSTYKCFGDLAVRKKEYLKGQKFYDSALKLYKKTYWKYYISETKQEIALVAIYLKQLDKAKRLLKVTRKEFEELKTPQLLLKNYQYSAMLDSALGNFSGAFAWQKEYQKISDARMKRLSALKMERAEQRYVEELKKMYVNDLRQKKEQKTKIQLFRYRLFAFIAMGVLGFISVFLFYVMNSRKKIKKLIRKIDVSNQELDASNQLKNKLFSIVSHDLKNEISGLDGSLKLLNDDTISHEEFKDIVPVLADRTQHTSIMLNNLLNWSKSQMNELKIKPVDFDIRELIAQKFELFKAKANQKNIQLHCKLEQTIIHADKDMIGIIAQNLIANAIKFCNPNDSITVFSEEHETYQKIHFKDTGVGIAPEYLKKLFADEIFTTTGTQNETGTGLGLRICKEFVEHNKGSINVTSTLGKGSTFSILLPKAKA